MLNLIIDLAIAAIPALFAADLATKTRKACKPLRPILHNVQFERPAYPTPDPWDLPLTETEGLEPPAEGLEPPAEGLEPPAPQLLLEPGAIIPEVLEEVELWVAPAQLPLVTVTVKATVDEPLVDEPQTKTRRTAAAAIEVPKPKSPKSKSPKSEAPKPKDTRSMAELRAACKAAGLTGYSKLKRNALLDLLSQA